MEGEPGSSPLHGRRAWIVATAWKASLDRRHCMEGEPGSSPLHGRRAWIVATAWKASLDRRHCMEGEPAAYLDVCTERTDSSTRANFEDSMERSVLAGFTLEIDAGDGREPGLSRPRGGRRQAVGIGGGGGFTFVWELASTWARSWRPPGPGADVHLGRELASTWAGSWRPPGPGAGVHLGGVRLVLSDDQGETGQPDDTLLYRKIKAEQDNQMIPSCTGRSRRNRTTRSYKTTSTNCKNGRRKHLRGATYRASMLHKQAALLVLLASVVESTTVELRSPCRSHPCLFYGPQDVPRLRLQAQTTHRTIAAEIVAAVKHNRKLRLPPVTYQEYAASWPEVWGNNLPPLALYLVLHPDDVDTARFLVHYMDRLASYESWRTTAAPEDDVAVSHSLVGFATALDMAYGRLDRDRRRRYVAKVAAMTEQLYTMSYSKWWGESLLQWIFFHTEAVSQLLRMWASSDTDHLRTAWLVLEWIWRASLYPVDTAQTAVNESFYRICVVLTHGPTLGIVQQHMHHQRQEQSRLQLQWHYAPIYGKHRPFQSAAGHPSWRPHLD
ncbi:hypothetical protein LSAT2_029078 [Lamellibrachia satsuma]|nr:hypothetical protein LSAT2_029078 [Lamellibrachia satsuma]